MSGSGEFNADVEELGSLSMRLERCTESMKHAGGNLRSASVDSLGNSRIDKAGAGFRSSREFGIDCSRRRHGAGRPFRGPLRVWE
ncbi:hypothetical protein EYS09_16125 [Streptomyces kasugaensis]|uniref:Uncharacterized protein n=1 Tax=Streptomyces kasugaensis TaxID=1946 RepID=A0A4V2JII6_STRKA|nr:hypothetical protein [Streptomyces kasugaensis]TBO58681.1 hypothetical protein EYS09_16125 [Streptomyces kasugaensis]